MWSSDSPRYLDYIDGRLWKMELQLEDLILQLKNKNIRVIHDLIDVVNNIQKAWERSETIKKLIEPFYVEVVVDMLVKNLLPIISDLSIYSALVEAVKDYIRSNPRRREFTPRQLIIGLLYHLLGDC